MCHFIIVIVTCDDPMCRQRQHILWLPWGFHEACSLNSRSVVQQKRPMGMMCKQQTCCRISLYLCLGRWLGLLSGRFLPESSSLMQHCCCVVLCCGVLCRGVCGKQLSCGHKCPDTCHAGPCAPCQVVVAAQCACREQQQQRLCHLSVWRCEKTCGKLLACGRHHCDQVGGEGFKGLG